ncbi:DUF6059 family protein [Kitasatospora sp. NPDC052896]|uniref:DUF6059 family protein n=1 Tax=Kitasatospora sp. NPDC052896 TaxID=3364061 RepID=UPI0037CA9EAF
MDRTVTVAAWLAGRLWHALVGYGALWFHPPGAAADPASARGTAPGHPERLCPELPTSPAERALWAQLRGLGE